MKLFLWNILIYIFIKYSFAEHISSSKILNYDVLPVIFCYYHFINGDVAMAARLTLALDLEFSYPSPNGTIYFLKSEMVYDFFFKRDSKIFDSRKCNVVF